MKRIFTGTLVGALVVLIGAAGTTDADARELVRFVDGRYLEVDEHRVQGDYVRIELEPGAIVVFEVDRIDWIERAGVRVYGPERDETVVLARVGSATEGDDAERSRSAATEPPTVRTVARDFSGRPTRDARAVEQ